MHRELMYAQEEAAEFRGGRTFIKRSLSFLMRGCRIQNGAEFVNKAHYVCTERGCKVWDGA